MSARPFARYEWLIAWRYLRARRSEGGVSVMTWISLVGIMLAVAALIITLAVRSGFRDEFVDTILGANAHVTVYSQSYQDENGQITRVIRDFDALAERIAAIPGVTRAAPLVKGQVMATANGNNTGVEVFGIRAADLMSIPRIVAPQESMGEIERFGDGIAMGSGVARALGMGVGDRVRLISPNGVKTPFGTSPRVSEIRGHLHLQRRALRHRPDAGLHAVRRGAALLRPGGRGRRDRGDGGGARGDRAAEARAAGGGRADDAALDVAGVGGRRSSARSRSRTR